MPPAQKSRGTLIAIIAGVVVVALIVVGAVLLLSGGGGKEFAGQWTPTDSSGGGLVIGDDLKVTLVTPEGSRFGPYSGHLSGGKLQVTISAADLGLGSGTGSADQVLLVMTHDKANDHLTVAATSAGSTDLRLKEPWKAGW